MNKVRMTRLARRRLLAVVASIAILPAGLGQAAASATGAENINLTLPVGNQVSGHITNSTGDPVAGADVGVCPDQFSCFVASAISDASGAFTILGITPGTYILEAQGSGPAGSLATYYGGPGTSVTDPSAAAAIDVTSNPTAIDVQLAPGFTLSGTLTGPGSVGVPGISVSANGPAGGGATTDTNGHYVIPGLVAGLYDVEVRPPLGSPYTDGYLDNGAIVQDFSPSVSISGDTAGVDATLVVGASISGTISGLARPATISISTANRESPVAPDGTFDVTGLWPDQPATLLVAEGQLNGFDEQFPVGVYDGSGTLTIDQSAALPIDLSGGNVSGLALAAPHTPSVTGSIKDQLGGAVAGFLTLCGDAGCAGTGIGAGGTYGFWNLPAGTYHLFVNAFDHPSGYVTSSGGVSSDIGDAKAIVIAGGDVVQTAVLPVGLTLSGRITGPGNLPVVGASVGASMPNGPIGGSATTDTNGDYVIRGLSAGDYEVRVDGPQPGPYLSGYWSSGGYVADEGEAGTVHVPSSAPEVTATSPTNGASNVPRTIQPTATFSGSVLNVSGSTVRLHLPGSTATIKATVTYDDATHVVTLKPKVRLRGRTSYSLEISGLTGIDGSPVGSVAVTFTTAR